jgi:Fic family protein
MIGYMLDGIETIAAETRDKMVSIRNLTGQTLESGKKKLRSKVYSKELIELLFRQPYTKAQTLVDAGIAERKTAAVYLRALEEAGILRSKKSGKEVLFLNVKLFQLLSK